MTATKKKGCHSKATKICRAADAVSACAQVKNGGRFSFVKTSYVRMSRYLDTSTTTQMAQNLGPTLKTQLFLLYEIFMFTHLPDYCDE